MKKNILKDSNSLLGFLISIKDENNNCNVYRIFDVVGSDKTQEIQMLVNELSNKDFIKQTNTCNIHIFEKGIHSYVGPAKKFWISVKVPLSYIFTYIMGILSTVLAQMIIHAITSKQTP